MSTYNKHSDSKEIGVQSRVQRFEDGAKEDDYNHVEQKYLGTIADQQEMHGLGRVQQLRVGPTCSANARCALYLTVNRGTSTTFPFSALAAP